MYHPALGGTDIFYLQLLYWDGHMIIVLHVINLAHTEHVLFTFLYVAASVT